MPGPSADQIAAAERFFECPLAGCDRKEILFNIGVLLAAEAASGGGAVSIADGADVTEGAISDALVAAGAAGTVSAKLRRISADIASLLANTPAKTPAFIAFVSSTSFVALTSKSGTSVNVMNNTGGDLTLDRGSGAQFILPDGTGNIFHVTANASELRLKAASGTPTISIEVW